MTAIVKRSAVKALPRYSDYRDHLRRDFWYSCAYCSLAETEALAVSFEIDHYIPKKANPSLEHEYSNLMYSCRTCNDHKWDYVAPEGNDEKAVLRVDEEDPRTHLRVANPPRVEGSSKKGEFNVDLLRLNRRALLRLRDLRRAFVESQEAIAHGVHELLAIGLDRMPVGQRVYLARLQERVGGQHEYLVDKVQEYVEDCLRSPMADKDDSNKRRRKYLEDERVMTPDRIISKGSRRRRRDRADPHV